MRTENHG